MLCIYIQLCLLLYILFIVYCLFCFGKKIGKITNKCNTVVVGQITCWLVFIFSKFVMVEKWKNGKMGHNINFWNYCPFNYKKISSIYNGLLSLSWLVWSCLVGVLKKNILELRPNMGFIFSMLVWLPGGVNRSKYFSNMVVHVFSTYPLVGAWPICFVMFCYVLLCKRQKRQK